MGSLFYWIASLNNVRGRNLKILKSVLGVLESLGKTLFSAACVVFFSKRVDASWRKTSSATAVILGNGPSLNADLDVCMSCFRPGSSDVWAVNNFCFSEKFTVIQPQFYVLADPNYWAKTVSEEVELSRDRFLRGLRERLAWPMTLLVPVAARGSYFLAGLENSFLTVRFYNSTPLSGMCSVSYAFMRRQLAMPAPLNVLVAATSLALCAQYKEIVLLGADHSWHEELTVNNDGEALVEQRHFYDEKVEAKPIYRPDHSCFTVGDMFERWGKVFKSYEFLQGYACHRRVRVINASSRSYIDAFRRMRISDLCVKQ